jgi:polysaccharide pyruvyl transferase WcaK-like protein
MTLRELRTHGPAETLPMELPAQDPAARTLVHIGIHNSANRNAGDTLLFPVVRRAFDRVLGPFHWHLRQAWEPLTPENVGALNESCDGIVLGGGGLLLRDQAGSDVGNSGWQWNSSVDAVRAIEVPLIVFAIGYNRFRGQPDFDPVFTEHIQAVCERAGFFGLRNTGSIRALGNYVPEALAKRIRRQFCPTTVIWQLYPEYRARAEAHDARRQRVLSVNAAFDRAEMRFGPAATPVLDRIAEAVRRAEQRGWSIIVTAHKEADRGIEPHLDAAGVSYDTVDLTDAAPDEVMAFYAEVDFAFGMRGHAQMIPFGLRRAFMSIISHDKMRFLLEDIDRLEWGVDVDAPDIGDRLLAQLRYKEDHPEELDARIAKAQQSVWEETRANLEEIGRSQFGMQPVEQEEV